MAATESKKSNDKPRVLSSVPASSEPRHAILQAVVASHPRPALPVVRLRSAPTQEAPQGSVSGLVPVRSEGPPAEYDLVERMVHLDVSVVKAHELPSMDITGSLDPYVEVKLGNLTGVTRHLEKNTNPVWQQR